MSSSGREQVLEQYRDGGNLSARIRLHQLFSTNRYGMFRWIFDQLALGERVRVLELGCGTAELWARNAERIPPRWRIVLSDFSAGMLKEARAKAQSIGCGCSAARIDARMLPFRGGAFDAVIANHLLYHVPDIPGALREIRRVLVPGGFCFAATMGRANLQELDAMVRRCFRVELSRAAARFGLESGHGLMNECFAKVDLIRYPDSLIVTQAQPLIDYVNSTSARASASDEQRAAFRAMAESEISARGSIHITKNTGMFIARA